MRIVHCIRAPVGGVFRHVCDLAALQNKAGHALGLICDSTTGGAMEAATLDRVRPDFSLGIHRFAMPRDIAPADIPLVWRLTPAIRALDPDILHAHGSKGGAYARIVGTLLRASGKRVARIYTPHGGSLHFDAASMRGRIYFAAERALAALTDGFVFVSRYEAETFAEKVGKPQKPFAIVYNGLRPEEFAPIAPADDARDFLFIGEIRDLKGPDVFLEALAAIGPHEGRRPSAVVVGDGPDRDRIRGLAVSLGLAGSVAFMAPMPARAAFRLARCLVVPSRKESLPYIVLEGTAAAMPTIATRVGGIPEIFGEEAAALVPPGDAEALAAAMRGALVDPAGTALRAVRLQGFVRSRFSGAAMAEGIATIYEQAAKH